MKHIAVCAMALVCLHAGAAPVACPDTPGVMPAPQDADGWTVSGTLVSADGRQLWQSAYRRQRWSGRLIQSTLATGAAAVTQSAGWEAGMPPAEERKIYTARVESGVFTTVPFTVSAWATDADQALKKKGLIDYLRGDRSREIGTPDGTLRARDHVLGDIVNSTMLHVAGPGPDNGDAARGGVLQANRDRPPVLYVGANDGMLHAFNTLDGSELFAYVPAAVRAQMALLASPAYVHRPYVDGGLVATQSMLGGQRRTVLAAGMGRGARGAFALDITDPVNFADGAGALWEFTERDDATMGHVIGAPVIGTFRVGEANQLRDFVIVSSSEPAALFLLAVDKPQNEAWQAGANYFRFPIQGDAANALGAAAIVVGTDGAVTQAYAGDLQGALWRFDFSTAAPWAGQPAATPLFVAADDAGTRQPITQQPQVVFAPGGVLVLFGTGRYQVRGDALAENFKVQSFYAVHDAPDLEPVAGRQSLARRSVDSRGRIAGDAFAYGVGAGRQRGWYLDFADSGRSGERSVTPALIEHGTVYFNTMIPALQPCEAGSGRLYALDALYGLSTVATATASGVGVPVAPVMAAVAANSADAGHASRQRMVVTAGSGGADGAVSARPAVPANTQRSGRLSWREILNWLELHDAANR